MTRITQRASSRPALSATALAAAVLTLAGCGSSASSGSAAAAPTTAAAAAAAASSTQDGGSGSGGYGQTFQGTVAITGTDPLSGTWTSEGITFGTCGDWAKGASDVTQQFPPGGPVGSSSLAIGLALQPGTYHGPGTYKASYGSISAGKSNFLITPTSGVTATIGANGSGSIVFSNLTYVNAVSGAVPATDSGTISWTCVNS